MFRAWRLKGAGLPEEMGDTAQGGAAEEGLMPAGIEGEEGEAISRGEEDGMRGPMAIARTGKDFERGSHIGARAFVAIPRGTVVVPVAWSAGLTALDVTSPDADGDRMGTGGFPEKSVTGC